MQKVGSELLFYLHNNNNSIEIFLKCETQIKIEFGMLYKFQYKLHPCGDTSGWTWQWQQVWSLKINYIHVETPQAEHDSDNKYDHLK